MHEQDKAGDRQDATGNSRHTAKDPVCGMRVDPHTTPHKAQYRDHSYYFCSSGCRSKFIADPERYVAPEQAKVDSIAIGTVYTCPMHPQSARRGRGRVRSAAWRSSR